jgi:hypothetical protein
MTKDETALAKRASIGGTVRMQKLSPAERTALAKSAAEKRWAASRIKALPDAETIPRATHWGTLDIGGHSLPCYRLDTGDRVFSLKGVVVSLMGTEGGQLSEYIKVKVLRPFLPSDLVPAENDAIPALITFDTGADNFTKYALGLPVERFMDLCSAYSTAAEHCELTVSQKRIAHNAHAFLRACAKVGIVALVDEATGYQYDRVAEELQLKLKVFLAEEMRKWEKTFPDDLWIQFGRLTKWHGSVHQRPKYWSKLVIELVYEYLDPDVAQWLRDNAPKPRHGQNYHQWLNGQYGLQRLIEHIWKLIGIASTCSTLDELKQKMQELYGSKPGLQFRLTFSKPDSVEKLAPPTLQR